MNPTPAREEGGRVSVSRRREVWWMRRREKEKKRKRVGVEDVDK